MANSMTALRRAARAYRAFQEHGDATGLTGAIRGSARVLATTSPGDDVFLDALRVHCATLDAQLAQSFDAGTASDLMRKAHLLVGVEPVPALRLKAAGALAALVEWALTQGGSGSLAPGGDACDRAVESLETAISSTDDTNDDWLRCVVRTSRLHQLRYHQTGEAARLDRAVALLERARAAGAADADLLIALGNAYLDRHAVSHAAYDVNLAVDVGRQAAALVPDSPPLERGLLTLGHALQQQSDYEWFHSTLDESIACFDAILAGPLIPPSTRILVNASLAQSLCKRGQVTASVADVERGMALVDEAVAACDPDDQNYAWLQGVRAAGQQVLAAVAPQADGGHALAAAQAMLVSARGTRDVTMAACRIAELLPSDDRFEQILETMRTHLTPSAIAASPWAAYATCRELGVRAAGQQEWAAAAELLRRSLDAREHLLYAQPTPSDLLDLLRDTRLVPVLLCLAQARAGDVDAAVVTIEAARSFICSHLLHALTPDANRLRAQREPRALYGRLVRASRDWHTHITAATRNTRWARRDPVGLLVGSLFNAAVPPSSDEGLDADAWLRAQAALEETIAEIRRQPGFDAFGRSLSRDEILAAAAEDVLVYLVPGESGHGGLALLADGGAGVIAPVWLPGLSGEEVASRRATFLLAQDRWRKDGDDRLFEQAITDDGGWLWEVAGASLAACLQGRERVFLVSGDGLQFFPMHAIGRRRSQMRAGESLLDHVAMHHVSSAASLRSARQVRRESGDDSCLAVCGSSAHDLPLAPSEVRTVTRHFTRSQALVQGEARRPAVLRELQRHDVWHFACHGRADILDPLATELELSDGTLRLGELLDLPQAPHRLAVLSACETGLGSLSHPEASMDAGETLLSCGVAGAVSTLWLVDDLAAVVLVARFYDSWRGRGMTVGDALREAQRWMRDTSAVEKAADLERSGLVERRILDRLRDCEDDLSAPIYWSAFRMNGL